MTKSKQPQYRFDGFEGEWEEKELGILFKLQWANLHQVKIILQTLLIIF